MSDRPTPVYLDHAATTPMLPVAIEAITAHLGDVGNPSSLHASGRRARRVVEESRERIAQALNCRPSEIVFTSGGTESDNLALKGIFWSRRAADPARTRILSSAVEHHGVLDPLEWLAEQQGAEVELLPVDRLGRLDLDALRASVERDPGSVALISVMRANNEVGTIQPVEEVVAVAAPHGIPVHTDAVQAVGKIPVDFAALGVDALAVAGHKVGGPFGVGALVARRELDVTPLLHGGGHERDVRSGTLDTPAIAGFAAAVEHSVKHQVEQAARISELRDELVRGVRAAVPDAIYNGDPVHRLPGNAHLKFPGCQGDSLLMLLDARGIECSTGSACSAGVAQPSHVLLAMGCSDEFARSSLRFSLGHTSTTADVAALVEAIGPVVERARGAGSPRKADGREPADRAGGSLVATELAGPSAGATG
ncbi:cysteine desulfurase family protein [Nocardioides sp.]|uniref:cysteine desulfurase family protein n=1 Tax=Nocardioides sp. TaxID=35761 RepID=UPI0035287467